MQKGGTWIALHQFRSIQATPATPTVAQTMIMAELPNNRLKKRPQTAPRHLSSLQRYRSAVWVVLGSMLGSNPLEEKSMTNFAMPALNQNEVPDIRDALPLGADDGPPMSDLYRVLKKRGAMKRLGINLMHKHFDLASDEVLVENAHRVDRINHVLFTEMIYRLSFTVILIVIIIGSGCAELNQFDRRAGVEKTMGNTQQSKLADTHSKTPVCDTFLPPLASFKPGLPEYYGVYLSSRNGYVDLKPTVVANRFGLTVGDLGLAVDGFDRPPPLSIKETNPGFFVYEQGVNVSEIQLSPLVCVGSRRAYEFNIKNTNPAFFHNVYRRNYNDIVEINLWQAKGIIQLRVAPVSGKQDMYHLVPVSSLAPGRYALYLPTNLHQYNMIFSASLARQTGAFYFEVR